MLFKDMENITEKIERALNKNEGNKLRADTLDLREP